MKNSNMPAMPMFNHNAEPCLVRDKNDKKKEMLQASGLSKREMMAMHAMQGFITHIGDYSSLNDLADDSVRMADALLAELEKDEEQEGDNE